MLYVYAIVDGPTFEPLSGEGFEMADVTAISCGPFAAAVSELQTAVEPATAENVWHHEHVLEQLMQHYTVLPLRFGMICADASALTTVLQGATCGLVRDLECVRGKVEIALHIAGTAADELPEAVAGAGRGAAYINARVYRHRREQAREAEAAQLSELLRHRLDPDLKDVHCVPAPATGFLVSCLVERDRVGAFTGALDRLQADYPYLDVVMTGPWPVYSFVATAPLTGDAR
jgi:hypothetical protein